MKIYSDGGLLGDGLCTLSALQYLIQKENKQGREPIVCFENKWLKDLMPKDLKYTTVDKFEENEVVDYKLSPTISWQFGIQDLHMIQGHFRSIKAPIPYIKDAKPRLEYPDIQVEKYDFIISPYSYSNGVAGLFGNNKFVLLKEWQFVVDYLQKNGYKIAIIWKDSTDGERIPNVPYIENKSLPEVCTYLSKVKKAVLSVDNGISHLVHCLEVPHLLLYPACLPSQWVTNANDNALVVQDWPINFSGQRIVDLIKSKFI